jgi:hypothetical protein
MTQFRAPSAKVRAELERLFEYVGLEHPYGPPLQIEDVFLLISDRFGPEVAAQCQIEIVLH